MPMIPVYLPRSMAAGNQSHDVHFQVRFLSATGVSLHPLQRAGAVGSSSHDQIPRMRAGGPGGIGAGTYPAGDHNLSLPPATPIGPGSSRDPKMMV